MKFTFQKEICLIANAPHRKDTGPIRVYTFTMEEAKEVLHLLQEEFPTEGFGEACHLLQKLSDAFLETDAVRAETRAKVAAFLHRVKGE